MTKMTQEQLTCMVTTRSSTTSSRVKKSAPAISVLFEQEGVWRGAGEREISGKVKHTDSSLVLIGEPLVNILVHE